LKGEHEANLKMEEQSASFTDEVQFNENFDVAVHKVFDGITIKYGVTYDEIMDAVK